MNNFFTDTLELDKYLENDIAFKKDHILNRALRTPKRIKVKKTFSFNNKQNQIKNPQEFSSLERIRIVVDSLASGATIEEICKKENISKKIFLGWKRDFLKAFNTYSEEILIKEKLSLTTKELILKEASLEAYDFFSKYIDLDSTKNLVIPKGEKLSTYSSFSIIENIIVLNKLNNFRQINKHLEEINAKYLKGLTFHYVSDMREVIQIALTQQKVKNPKKI